MRKTIILLTVSILLASCYSNKKDINRIKENAIGYIVATSNYDIEAAKPFATKETREVTLPLVEKNIMPLVDSTFLAVNIPATATIDSIELYVDTALVFYTKTTPLSTSNGTLTVIKEDGLWLVDVILKKAEE